MSSVIQHRNQNSEQIQFDAIFDTIQFKEVLFISVYKQVNSGKDCLFKASSQSKARLYLGALWNTDCPSPAKDAKDDCKEHWNSLWLKTPHNVSLGSCLVNAEN